MSFAPFLITELPIAGQSEFELSPGKNLVGREAPADIVIPMNQISRRHASIEYVDFVCFITDLGSTNGTYVNGRQVESEPVRVEPGDEVVFGGAITMRFNDPSATPQVGRIGRLKGLWINEQNMDVWVDALPVKPPLSASQLKLLQLLYVANGCVVPREEIVAHIWPEYDPATVTGEAVDGLIKRLRQRLRQTQPKQEYVQVIRGHGLRVVLPE